MIRAIVASTVIVLVVAPAARAAPCFPERRSVRIDQRLARLAPDAGEDYQPVGGKGTWGTCTADRGQVRDADGTLVVQIGCGLLVRVPGLADEYGVEVGMRGERMLLAYGDGPSSKLLCMATHEPRRKRVSCRIPDQHREPRGPDGTWRDGHWSYIVRGHPPKGAVDEDGILRGEAALAFFRDRTIVEMVDRGICH